MSEEPRGDRSADDQRTYNVYRGGKFVGQYLMPKARIKDHDLPGGENWTVLSRPEPERSDGCSIPQQILEHRVRWWKPAVWRWLLRWWVTDRVRVWFRMPRPMPAERKAQRLV